MCIRDSLSSGLVGKVQKELIEGGYSPDTPAAVVYKASWSDEKKFVTTLGRLEETMKKENITKTALIIVGKAVSYTHLYCTVCTYRTGNRTFRKFL